MRIRVNGVPAPQGSKRHVGNGRMIEMSKAVGPWREAVRGQTQATVGRDGPERGPVGVSLTFFLTRPKYHYRGGQAVSGALRPSAPLFPDHRPDLDKLVRAVLDGVTAGGAIGDDCQVVALAALKRWASESEPAGCEIVLEAAS